MVLFHHLIDGGLFLVARYMYQVCSAGYTIFLGAQERLSDRDNFITVTFILEECTMLVASRLYDIV